MYMSLMLGRNLPGFCINTAYRFMKMGCINWIRFITILSPGIVNQSIYNLTSDQRVNVFVIDENEIIRIYGKRWNIEVFFKVCKSYLHLAKECRSLSYDAVTAHVTIVFTRYMMLAVENRESQDERSLGELFLYFSDELADITWLESLKLLMELFRVVMKNCFKLSDETVSELIDIFISSIPSEIQAMLKAV